MKEKDMPDPTNINQFTSLPIDQPATKPENQVQLTPAQQQKANDLQHINIRLAPLYERYKIVSEQGGAPGEYQQLQQQIHDLEGMQRGVQSGKSLEQEEARQAAYETNVAEGRKVGVQFYADQTPQKIEKYNNELAYQQQLVNMYNKNTISPEQTQYLVDKGVLTVTETKQAPQTTPAVSSSALTSTSKAPFETASTLAEARTDFTNAVKTAPYTINTNQSRKFAIKTPTTLKEAGTQFKEYTPYTTIPADKVPVMTDINYNQATTKDFNTGFSTGVMNTASDISKAKTFLSGNSQELLDKLPKSTTATKLPPLTPTDLALSFLFTNDQDFLYPEKGYSLGTTVTQSGGSMPYQTRGTAYSSFPNYQTKPEDVIYYAPKTVSNVDVIHSYLPDVENPLLAPNMGGVLPRSYEMRTPSRDVIKMAGKGALIAPLFGVSLVAKVADVYFLAQGTEQLVNPSSSYENKLLGLGTVVISSAPLLAMALPKRFLEVTESDLIINKAWSTGDVAISTTQLSNRELSSAIKLGDAKLAKLTGENVRLYHGTTGASAERALIEGLNPAKEVGISRGLPIKLEQVYATEDLARAKGWGGRAEYGMGKPSGSGTAVLQIDLPKRVYEDLVIRTGIEKGGGSEVALKNIPSRYITKFDESKVIQSEMRVSESVGDLSMSAVQKDIYEITGGTPLSKTAISNTIDIPGKITKVRYGWVDAEGKVIRETTYGGIPYGNPKSAENAMKTLGAGNVAAESGGFKIDTITGTPPSNVASYQSALKATKNVLGISEEEAATLLRYQAPKRLNQQVVGYSEQIVEGELTPKIIVAGQVRTTPILLEEGAIKTRMSKPTVDYITGIGKPLKEEGEISYFEFTVRKERAKIEKTSTTIPRNIEGAPEVPIKNEKIGLFGEFKERISRKRFVSLGSYDPNDKLITIYDRKIRDSTLSTGEKSSTLAHEKGHAFFDEKLEDFREPISKLSDKKRDLFVEEIRRIAPDYEKAGYKSRADIIEEIFADYYAKKLLGKKFVNEYGLANVPESAYPALDETLSSIVKVNPRKTITSTGAYTGLNPDVEISNVIVAEKVKAEGQFGGKNIVQYDQVGGERNILERTTKRTGNSRIYSVEKQPDLFVVTEPDLKVYKLNRGKPTSKPLSFDLPSSAELEKMEMPIRENKAPSNRIIENRGRGTSTILEEPKPITQSTGKPVPVENVAAADVLTNAVKEDTSLVKSAFKDKYLENTRDFGMGNKIRLKPRKYNPQAFKETFEPSTNEFTGLSSKSLRDTNLFFSESLGKDVFSGKSMKNSVTSKSEPNIKSGLDVNTGIDSEFERVTPQERTNVFQVPVQGTKQIQNEIFQSPTPTIHARPFSFDFPRPVPPPENPKIKKKLKLPEEKKMRGGLFGNVPTFSVQIKRRGKYIPVATGLSKGESLLFGSDLTLRNIARSFKIKETGQTKEMFGGDIDFMPSNLKFRNYKVRKGKAVPLQNEFIQRTSANLQDPLEQQMLRQSKQLKSMGMFM